MTSTEVELTPTRGTQALSAAVLSALLAGPGNAAQHEPPQLHERRVQWQTPRDVGTSFQLVTILHGTAPTTLLRIHTDPWDELLRLQENWDGNQALPISIDALGHAKRFVNQAREDGLSFTPFADPDGHVGLESEKTNSVAYLVVAPDNRFSYVIRTGDTVNRGDNVSERQMREILALLH